MTSTDSNIKIRSTFLEGILSCFDPFGFFSDFSPPKSNSHNPVIDDRRKIHQDYNNSLDLIDKELKDGNSVNGK